MVARITCAAYAKLNS